MPTMSDIDIVNGRDRSPEDHEQIVIKIMRAAIRRKRRNRIRLIAIVLMALLLVALLTFAVFGI